MKEKDLRFLEFDWNGKKLFIVTHHSIVLKCWKKAYKDNLISLNSILFHIDKHPDFYFDPKNKEKSIKLLSLSEEELDILIKKDLYFDNSEFIVNAMFSGLIKDGISIHFEDCNNCYGQLLNRDYSTTERYTFTEDKKEHNFYIYKTEDLTNLFGYQSLLDDSCIHQDTKSIFNITNSLILDIDLDFFTYVNEQIYPKNKRDIQNQILSRSFQNILGKAKIITIALEPNHCGKEIGSLEILELFNEHLFKPAGLDILKDVQATFLT